VQWIPATTEGRVIQILILPGSQVKSDTILLELGNPELVLQARDAELQLRAGEAEMANQRVQLENQRMNLEASAAQAKAESLAARLRADADEELSKEGLVPEIQLKVSRAKAEEMATKYEIEQRKLKLIADSIRAQLEVQAARVNQLRAAFELRSDLVAALQVRAGIDGVLQQMDVQVGQQIAVGSTLAKVAQPDRLKAQLKIAETQAKDIQIGQGVTIDTRNGEAPGHVSRIDPAVQNGTVLIDVSLDGVLPKGARPDLTVDGTVELERLSEVLYMGRPAMGQEDSTVSLFKLTQDG
jgi:HlyD family secretion protein